MTTGRPPGSANAEATGRRALPGAAVAGITALVSGVAVFVNSYGVHALPPPSVYTTAKNLVAVLVLTAFALAGRRLRLRGNDSVLARFVSPARPVRPSGAPPSTPSGRSMTARGPLRWLGLAYVGVVGGGIAFVLFFVGLEHTTAAPAAFWHDTLVVWVALLGVGFLGERLRWWNLAAIAALVAGQVVLAGGVGHLAADRGELMVLGATLLWAVEVVVAKLLLRDLPPSTLSLVRMGVGAATLVVYVAATGAMGALLSLDAVQLGWALLTGAILAAYVGTWMTALARARALDVTSVLVASALVTWLLQTASGAVSPAPEALGLLLVAAGAGTVAWMSRRRVSSDPAGAIAR